MYFKHKISKISASLRSEYESQIVAALHELHANGHVKRLPGGFYEITKEGLQWLKTRSS